jgi:hypothetical protein
LAFKCFFFFWKTQKTLLLLPMYAIATKFCESKCIKCTFILIFYIYLSFIIVFGRVEFACSSWNWFFLNPNYSISTLEFYRIYCYRSLTCTCKLAKVCCLKNILRNGYREWESVIFVKNGSYRSKIAPNHYGKILS